MLGAMENMHLRDSMTEEKAQQIRNVESSRAHGQDEAHIVGAHLQAATSLSALLQATARDRENVFAALMEAVKMHSLGQISHAVYGASVPTEYVVPPLPDLLRGDYFVVRYARGDGNVR
jgi:hypothetical protein